MTEKALPSAAQVREQVNTILASETFAGAARSTALLKYLVEHALTGKGESLKEYALGVDVFGRDASFDPRTDPIARVEASRLRKRLESYYGTAGRTDAVLVSLPTGSYLPKFELRAAPSLESIRVSSSRLPALIPWLLACAAILTAIVAWLASGRSVPTTSHAEVQQFEVELIPRGIIGSLVSPEVVIAPDGSRVVFAARGHDDRVVYLYSRRLAETQVTRVAGSAGARSPFFSPDGRWIGFLSPDGKVKKVNLEGGEPVILCNAWDMFGASWGKDGTIIAAIGPRDALSICDGESNDAKPVIVAESKVERLTWPQLLPDGQHVIYSVSAAAGADSSRVEVQSIRGGERRVLVRGGAFGRYLRSGAIAYVNQGTLFVAPFDLESLAVTGAAVPMIEDVSSSFTFGYAQYDVSDSGTLVYRRGAENQPVVLDWIDRAGVRSPFIATPERFGWMKLSPDGKQLAATVVSSGNKIIRVYDTERDSARTVVSEGCDCGGLVWIGNTLVYGTRTSINSIDTSRENAKPVQLTDEQKIYVPWSFNERLARLAFHDRTVEHGFNLWTAQVHSNAAQLELDKPELFLDTFEADHYPAFSPDGRWMAYSQNGGGTRHVFVRHFPDDGYQVRLSADEGSQVRWSPNGREILFRTFDRRIMRIAYRVSDGRFIAEAPEPWSEHVLADAGPLPNYDIAPDGERILAALPGPDEREHAQQPSHATFVLNFHAMVEAKLAGR